MTSTIQPYKIHVPDSKLQRLKAKLSVYDLPDEVADAEPWSRGPPLADIKRLAAYWADGFDWRGVEARLNETLPQYTTKVDVDGFGTYDVHFVHKQSRRVKGGKNAIPLLFVHGWPGSFIEVSKILPLLVDGDEGPAFHVVAPSLIDFGFSSASSKVGLHSECVHESLTGWCGRPNSTSTSMQRSATN